MLSPRIGDIWSASEVPYRARVLLLAVGGGIKVARGSGRVPVSPLGDVRVPLGSGLSVWLAAHSLRIDYLTFLDIFVDRSFAVEPRGAIVIDAGGHRGYFGAFALLTGAYAVHSLEPASDNRSTLERTARLFRRRGNRWTVEGSAVGAREGAADLHISSESWSHSLHEPESGEVMGVERVRVRTLSSVIADVRTRYPRRPLVVKLNVERVAGEVILATPRRVWAGVAQVMFDYEPGTREPLGDLLDHLGAAGQRVTWDNGRCFRLSTASSARRCDEG